MFNKILIANRGEIAVRIARTCKRLGIGVVAVYSDADRTALHVRRADEAYWIGPSEARLSYLNGAAIIAAAKQSGAEAVHPGYGFLSENAGFAQQVIDAGLVWIGPPPAAMRAMGDKAVAKRLVAAAGVPVVPGYDGEDQSDARLRAEAEQIGYPLLIKATAGGGGRGMREVHEPVAFQEALESARREALSAFGDDRVLLERLITQARHVEVQVLGDEHGHLVHLGERDCSVQRRHQKVIEEAPSPAVDEALRARMGQAAVEAARRAGYTNAGTVEFLLAPDESFYFLEMNTRLQVEHPVTEMITGFDLVELQLRAAAGEPLPLAQDDVKLSGHAIEARLYAEDPYHDYLPASGKLNAFSFPAVEGTRVDRGYEQSDEVSSYYDSLLAKLVGFNGSRDGALRNLEMLVGTSKVAGVATNLPLLRAVLRSVEFIMGRVTTDALPKIWQPNLLVDAPTHDALLAVAATIVSGTLSDRDELPRSPWESA
ncbi:MAG TPA: biotin carboxylase N-terminal domain-containing protein, partial [Dehalococcoidia bacterium]|nr:biotin carboxylase N-terminal domain-containing protein [Dehalococcoidia bacterium]